MAKPPAKKSPTISASVKPKLAMEVVSLPIDALTPYPNNPRVIPDTAIEKVAASIDAYGWQQPIVVDGGHVVIMGHTRLLAAQRLGLKTVPVKIETSLSPNLVRLLRIADNRTNQETLVDNAKLMEELKAAGEEGLSAEELSNLTGMNESELGAILAEGGVNLGGGTDDPPADTDTDGSFPLLGEQPTQHQCPKCGTKFNDKGEVQAHVSGKKDASGAKPSANAKPGSRRRTPGAAKAAIGEAPDP